MSKILTEILIKTCGNFEINNNKTLQLTQQENPSIRQSFNNQVIIVCEPVSKSVVSFFLTKYDNVNTTFL